MLGTKEEILTKQEELENELEMQEPCKKKKRCTKKMNTVHVGFQHIIYICTSLTI